VKSSPRVAIVHDWLTVYAGAEKLLAELLALYPQADLFSLIDFFPDHLRHHLQGKKAKTTFLQHLPFVKKKYPLYLPLMPMAIESLDLTSYDLILSSSHAVAHGVIPSPEALHICYCHSPMRYAWDRERDYPQNFLSQWLFHKMRLWDATSAARVDLFVANSQFVAKRIEKAYRRSATVIYNPIDISFFTPVLQKEDFYMTASRLVPYKKIDLIVKAFAQLPSKKLLVIGEGPERKKLEKMASKNVEILGYQSDEVLREKMQKANAFIFAGVEDFGRVSVEAQACGTPVIAYEKGGLKETVVGLNDPHPTGCFFSEQTPASLIDAIKEFEKNREKIRAEECHKNAARFSPARFRLEMTRWIEKAQRNREDESTHTSRWKRNPSMADVQELFSEAVSQNRQRKLLFAADDRQDEGSRPS
jgi:glycosyltransferase involved in cell wall biosynthesis